MKSDKDDSKQAIYYCDICASPMLERNCKLICANCGYTRDCSDP